MKCRQCGTEIAANALICYRCGEATAEPRIPPPPAARRRSGGGGGNRWLVPLLAAAGAAAAAAGAAWSWGLF